MKIVKRILAVTAILVGIVLIAALFIKKDYAVEKEIVVSKPKEAVFDYIKHLKNQDYYSTFAMKDPQMKKTFRGTDATVGFIYAWDGNSDAGKGEQEIKTIKDGERVDIDLRFEEPMEGKAESYMVTEGINANETKVRWGIKSSMPYPFNIMRIFFDIEDMMGKELSTSLGNLKANMEKTK